MLNLFKRVKKNIAMATKSPQSIIAEIHAEFDSSTEKLLAEARWILGINVDLSKSESLKKLGFAQSREVVVNSEISKKREQSDELQRLILDYQARYPNNKFITEEMVKSICEKYGLLFGDASRYKGDVPQKNINEMLEFFLKEEDCVKYVCGYYKDEYVKNWGTYYISSVKGEGSWGYVDQNTRALHIKNDDVDVVYEKPEFKICATEKEFDTRFMTVRDGYKLELKDPIVLQPIKGGYLIVTKWGLEASDGSLINEKQN